MSPSTPDRDALAPRRRPTARGPVAVVDIGSNSGRVVVYAADAAGQLRILASTRAALRLVSDVDEHRRLSPESIERTLEALRDFKAMAAGAGARRVIAVATAAMRDAANGAELIRRARRELGIGIEVIDGDREARYGFVGAVHGLPVESGLLFDLGGGSLQIARFRGRRLLRDWSLPLGALRLSRRFLESDPPGRDQIRRLKAFARRKLDKAGLPRLRPGEALVGTGGTIRNLAKVDRAARRYPITRLHGYALSRKRLAAVARLLAGRRLAQRERLAGLSDERGDSIVGGAALVETLMEALGATRVRVSGQGVREGLAQGLLRASLPRPETVRAASVASLASRFSTWRAASAQRRRRIARSLHDGLAPGAKPELREALDHAANLLDVGRAIDFFDRHRHVAEIVVATELDGFSHRDVALVAAIVLAARDERLRPGDFGPLLDAEDRRPIARAGLILALADDIEERCPPGGPVSLRLRRGPDDVAISVPRLLAWRPRGIGPRFERAFGRRLVVVPGGGLPRR